MNTNLITFIKNLQTKYYNNEITTALLIEDIEFEIKTTIKDDKIRGILLEILDRGFNLNDPYYYTHTLKRIDDGDKELLNKVINNLINNYNHFMSL